MKTAHGMQIPATVDDAISVAHTALVVYDMQIGIIRQLPHGASVVARVGELLAAARAVQLRTFFLRHLSLPVNLMGVFQTRQAMQWQRVSDPAAIRPWFLRGTPGQAIVPELEPRESEAVFDKIGMSAFEGTPLNTALRDCGIRSILLAGVATEIGLEPTVRHAADLGYIPILVEDACGAGHAEAGERAIASMRYMGDAMFTTVAEVQQVLRGSRPHA